MHDDPFFEVKRVRIREDGIQPDEWWDRHFDTVVLGKIEPWGYLNNPRANLRFFAAVWVNIGWFSLYVLIGGWVALKTPEALQKAELKDLTAYVLTPFTLFLGSVSGVFWQEKIALHKKWEYLAGLYNEMTKTPHSTGATYKARELLRVALALDLLVMDMWSHRSYADLFHDCLAEAILDHARPITSGRYQVANLTTIGLSRKAANAYLSKYQEKLLEHGRPVRSAS